MDAGEVSVRVVAKDDNFTAFMTRARREAQALGKTIETLGHGTVSSMQASSAAIRLLEGGMTGNIRAAERFLGMLPGVGAALQAAFPVFGAAAFLGVFAKVGEEIFKASHELNQIRNIAGESFAKLTEGAQKNADSLRVTNDKLEEQIALMEHMPVNTMATALDEARQRADELAISLNNDYEQFKKVIEKSQEGMLSGLFNKGVDTKLGGDMENQLANIRTLAREQRDALKAGNQDAADDLGKKLRAAQDASLSFADSETAKRKGIANAGTVREAPYATVYGPQDQNFDAINAFKDLVSSQEDTADQQGRNTGDQARLKALGATSKAQKDLYDRMQEGLAEQKAQYGVSIADELAYWSARISALTKGTDQYHTVLMETFKLQSDLYKEMQEGKKKYLESAKGDVEGNDLLGEGQQKLITEPAVAQNKRNDESQKQYNEAVAKSAEIQFKTNAAMDESAISIGLAQGKIAALSAATAMATIHDTEHAAAIREVTEALAAQKSLNDQKVKDGEFTDKDRENANRNADKDAKNQTDEINGQYQVTSQQDAAAIYANTNAGVFTTDFNRMVDAWTNAAQQVVGLFEASMSSINSTLVNVVTSRNRAHQIPREFEAMGHSIFTDATSKSLQASEGMIGKMFGFGGGAKVAHVHVDNWPGDIAGAASSVTGIAGKAAGWLGGLFSGKSGAPTSTIPSGGGYDFGSNPLASMAMDALPFFAGGGNFVANRPMLVGDMGPEILVPGNSGSIIPNHQIGGGTTHNISIDARGSTDPAATEAAIHRAMGQYLPAAVGASVGAVKEQSRRVPLSHR
jgi:hypothetical protein